MVVVVCPKCKYRWEYKGKRSRATCPNCGRVTSLANKETTNANMNNTKEIQQKRVQETNRNPRTQTLDLPDKLSAKQLAQKTGAKILEAKTTPKGGEIVIVDVPDDKAEEFDKRFTKILEEETKKS